MENLENELNSALDLINSENYSEAKIKLEHIIRLDENNIEALKHLGLCEVNLDNPIDAIKVFKKITTINKEDTTSLFYLAGCYNKTGQKAFAIENFKKVIELRANYIDAYKNLSMIYVECAQYDNAIELAKKAIEISDTDDSSLYHMIATAYMLKGDTLNAIKYLEPAFNMNPEHIQIANSLSVCYMNNNMPDKALPVLNKIYEVDKKNTLTLYNLGIYHQKTGDFKKALEYLQLAYEKEPVVTLLSALANCALKAKEYETASVLYKNLVSAHPNNNLYRLSYISVLETMEDFENALININALLETDSKNVAYLKKKGAYLRKLGRYEKSIEVFNILIKRGKLDVEVYYNLAFDYVELSDFDTAKEMFKKCITLEPNNPHAHKDLGVLYLKMNFYDWAVDEIKAAINLEGDVAEFHYALGVCYMMLSKIEEAKIALENAIGYDPNFADAWAYYGYIYLLNKEYDKALVKLQKALEIEPNNFLAKSHIAKYYFAIEKWEIAKQFLIDILDTTNDDETINMLGICYMNTNEFEKAHNLFHKVLNAYQKNHILLTNLAKCEYKMGKKDEALEHIRQALMIFEDYKEALELLKEIKNAY